jgi:hypothetical protein
MRFCYLQGDALVNAVKGLHLQEQRQHDKVRKFSNISMASVQVDFSSLLATNIQIDKLIFDIEFLM